MLASGLMAAGLIAPTMFAATSDEKDVLIPIQAMFDGMAKRDAAAIKASALPGATMVLMHDGETEQITFEAFGERVGKGKTQTEERIHDPLMRVDNDLAMVWAPFEFRVNGKVDHCGTDLFNLVHMDGKWLIANFAATVRKDCGAK
jgi:Putative lumazine-binding